MMVPPSPRCPGCGGLPHRGECQHILAENSYAAGYNAAREEAAAIVEKAPSMQMLSVIAYAIRAMKPGGE